MTNPNPPIQSGERQSFFKLFQEKGYHIEIPIIQRDYAQGRASNKEVRTAFLNALYNYLEENEPNRDLDFVYGNLTEEENPRFIPLDGQQRLTTLFLLHWYLAHISGNIDLLKEVLGTRTNPEEAFKSRFTYETRTSSREFCDALIANSINFTQLLDSDAGRQNSLSKTIQDCGWYYLSWENDPTIQSMLTMLDAIHIKFAGKSEFFDRLISTEHPIITFLFLNLKEFKLTDDLYIKMNARGKPLTAFETFKAKLEQHIALLNDVFAIDRRLIYGEEEQEVSTAKYFSHKIDTHWTDLFWHYKKETSNVFDGQLMNFIKVMVTNQYAVHSPRSTQWKLGFLLAKNEVSFAKYQEIDALSVETITVLINALDELSKGEDGIEHHITGSFYFDEESIFSKVLADDLSYMQRVQFHAYIQYLILHEGDSEGLDDWMRVIYNLTENTRFDISAEFVRAIKAVETLLPESKTILAYLKDEESNVDAFNIRQVQEEKIKACLLLRENELWKDCIQPAEKHSYFKGQIGFLLEFCGIIAYYEEQGHCDWSVDENETLMETFVSYASKAQVVFDSSMAYNSDFVWERAVLTKGNYLIDTTAYRLNFLNTLKNTRDYSWKRLLRLPPATSEGSEQWLERRNCVKAVFDDPRFLENNLEQSLSDICATLPGDWRDYFITTPELMRYCGNGFIRFESERDIKLLSKSQLNSYHVELYTYHFYLQYLKRNEVLSPFTQQNYYPINSKEYDFCISLMGWSYKDKKYDLDISFYEGQFCIDFYKLGSEKEETHYADEIKAILTDLEFQWGKLEGWQGYVLFKNTKEETFESLTHLCERLTTLTL